MEVLAICGTLKDGEIVADIKSSPNNDDERELFQLRKKLQAEKGAENNKNNLFTIFGIVHNIKIHIEFKATQYF